MFRRWPHDGSTYVAWYQSTSLSRLGTTFAIARRATPCARPHAADHLGLVARSDLMQLYLTAQLRGNFANQLSKVHIQSK